MIKSKEFEDSNIGILNILKERLGAMLREIKGGGSPEYGEFLYINFRLKPEDITLEIIGECFDLTEQKIKDLISESKK